MFAEQNGFTVINNSSLLRPSTQPTEMTTLIGEVKTSRQDQGGSLAYLRSELDRLYTAPNLNTDVIPMQKGKGADIILEKNGVHYIYDTKTVQVNADNGNTFNEKIILWICYYKYRYGIEAQNIQARIIFPYNSLDENDDQSWWGQFGGRILPLTADEVSVGNEFWQFMTGNPSALASIISGFEELRLNEEFILFYKQVFNCVNYEARRNFAFKVKVRRAEHIYNVRLIEGQPENARIRLAWTHMIDGETCTFNARVGEFNDGATVECDRCGQMLTSQ